MPNYTVDKKQYKVLLFFCYSLVYFFIFYAYSRNCVTGFSISIFQDSVLISPPGLFKKKKIIKIILFLTFLQEGSIFGEEE